MDLTVFMLSMVILNTSSHPPSLSPFLNLILKQGAVFYNPTLRHDIIDAVDRWSHEMTSPSQPQIACFWKKCFQVSWAVGICLVLFLNKN